MTKFLLNNRTLRPCFWHLGGLFGGSECSNDAHEVLCLERCSADESTVDVGFGEEFGCVAWLAAASVEDGHVVGHSLAILLTQQPTDEGMDLLCLIACSGLACSDGPDGLVGDDDVGHLLGSEVEQ